MQSKFLPFLLILLVFSSCQQDKRETEIPLEFVNKTVVKKSGENCELEGQFCSIISLEMLRATGPEEVSQKINKRLEEHVIRIVSTEEAPRSESAEELAENFLKQQQRTAEEFEESMPWKAVVNQSVYSNTDSLVSIGVDARIFTGGAHGYSSLTFLNFNPKTGEQLPNNALFTEEFTKYAEKKFREKENIPMNTNINSTGFLFENDSFQLPQNIGFGTDSLLLVYNPYEISSYAEGEISMKFALDEVQQFLKLEQK